MEGKIKMRMKMKGMSNRTLAISLVYVSMYSTLYSRYTLTPEKRPVVYFFMDNEDVFEKDRALFYISEEQISVEGESSILLPERLKKLLEKDYGFNMEKMYINFDSV
jgi:hypothetical protein